MQTGQDAFLIGGQLQDIVFLEGNLVSLKRKKQNVVSRSSAESEYKAMANMTLDLVWIRNLWTEIGFPSECLMRLYDDNKL